MSTFIPVKAEEWAKMVEATKLAADLLSENKRLRRAGDAMAEALDDGEPNRLIDDWHDAKQGM